MLAHLPNVLTLSRLAGGVLIFLFYQPTEAAAWVLPLFGALMVTDALDGYLARRWQAISRLGQVLDPLADKVLIWGLAWQLWNAGLLPSFFLSILVLRDGLIVLAVLAVYWRDGHLGVVSPSFLGKVTAASLMATLGAVLLHHHLDILPRDMVVFLVFTGPVLMLMSLWTYTNFAWRALWKEEQAA